jgi:hypothetical protein
MIDDDGVRSPVTAATEAEDALRTGGQRRVNLIWEGTQALIALTVTIGTIYTAVLKIDATVLSNAFFLVIGFYFGRTNHQRVGGVQLGR